MASLPACHLFPLRWPVPGANAAPCVGPGAGLPRSSWWFSLRAAISPRPLDPEYRSQLNVAFGWLHRPRATLSVPMSRFCARAPIKTIEAALGLK